ncbi:MAG: MarR family transcriptional regulator [Acidobacteriota bacterium]
MARVEPLSENSTLDETVEAMNTETMVDSVPIDGESPEVEEVRRAFVRLWGAMGSFWGISPTTARVFSWLLSRAEPADTDAIMEGLELSRGAVSMACRELRDWGLVHPERPRGSRRVSFVPTTDFEKVIRNIVAIRKRREWDPILEHLHEWIPRLEATDDPEAKILRERLRSLEGLVTLADSMIEVFLEGGMVSRLGLKLLANAARPSRGGQSTTSKDP